MGEEKKKKVRKKNTEEGWIGKFIGTMEFDGSRAS